jgi:hypothetical protein
LSLVSGTNSNVADARISGEEGRGGGTMRCGFSAMALQPPTHVLSGDETVEFGKRSFQMFHGAVDR